MEGAMDRLWKTDGDFCMLLARVVLGGVLLFHAVTLIAAVKPGAGALLSLLGAVGELFGSFGLLAGFLARVFAGALLLMVSAGLARFGNAPPGRGLGFYLLAAAILWIVIVHGAGPYSV